jgi:hypothetical protein
MWYRVVYIGGIEVLLKVLSRWHKRNMWFLHFNFFSFPSSDMAIFSNFKRKFSFQISKMKIFKFFHFKVQKWKFLNFFISKFRGIFQLVWPIFFKFQNQNFSKFSISLWWYGQFFSKFKNTIQFEFQKMIFQFFYFKF